MGDARFGFERGNSEQSARFYHPVSSRRPDFRRQVPLCRAIGPHCYASSGCADIIGGLARRPPLAGLSRPVWLLRTRRWRPNRYGAARGGIPGSGARWPGQLPTARRTLAPDHPSMLPSLQNDARRAVSNRGCCET